MRGDCTRSTAATAQRLEFYQIREARLWARGGPVENRGRSAVNPVAFEAIERAAQLLHDGALIAFPTETVYGLGAAARNADAVRRLFAMKGRPADHPVIVHLAGADLLPRWARETGGSAGALRGAFWPGPLTLILPRAST